MARDSDRLLQCPRPTKTATGSTGQIPPFVAGRLTAGFRNAKPNLNTVGSLKNADRFHLSRGGYDGLCQTETQREIFKIQGRCQHDHMWLTVVHQGDRRLFSNTVIDPLAHAIAPAVDPPDAITGPSEIAR